MAVATTTVAEEILQEHELVRHIVRELEMMGEEGEALGPEPGWCRRMYYELIAFHRHLLRHFELEESGGFLEEVVALRPQASDQVETLRQDHDRILVAVDDLISECDHLALGMSSSYSLFRKKLTEMLMAIKRHEIKENDLIQRVFYQDVVAVD